MTKTEYEQICKLLSENQVAYYEFNGLPRLVIFTSGVERIKKKVKEMVNE